MFKKTPIVLPSCSDTTPDPQELKINRLTFVRMGKSPIMVKFGQEEYCILSEIDALRLYELLKDHLDK